MSDANPETGADTVDGAVSRLLAQPEPVERPTAPEPEQEPAPEAAEADEVEADDAAPDDAGGGDEEDSEPEGEEEPQLFSVKVNGEEKQVTLDELLKGYSLESDYRRKTSTLAEERKQIEQVKAQVEQERQRYAEGLQAYLSNLQPLQEPDWVELAKTDPAGYVEQKAAWDAEIGRRQRAYQEYQATRETQLREHLAREQSKLPDLIPEWRDTKKAAEEAQALHGYAVETLGFAPQEAANVHDARLVLMLRKAWMYDKLMADKPAVTKKIAAAPKVQKPGAVRGKGAELNEQVAATRQKLKRSGSVDDAVALLRARGL